MILNNRLGSIIQLRLSEWKWTVEVSWIIKLVAFLDLKLSFVVYGCFCLGKYTDYL